MYEIVDPQSPISCALADENEEQFFDYFSGLSSDLNVEFEVLLSFPSLHLCIN